MSRRMSPAKLDNECGERGGPEGGTLEKGMEILKGKYPEISPPVKFIFRITILPDTA